MLQNIFSSFAKNVPIAFSVVGGTHISYPETSRNMVLPIAVTNGGVWNVCFHSRLAVYIGLYITNFNFERKIQKMAFLVKLVDIRSYQICTDISAFIEIHFNLFRSSPVPHL